jgi:phenylpyruvate tautomerase PptA (4-oxalocrotonate tautomerase family)
MPICHIEAPPGISPEAKKRMMEKITAAIDEGYNHIGDTFIFLHEDKLENVMLNGRFQSENPKFKEAFKKGGA